MTDPGLALSTRLQTALEAGADFAAGTPSRPCGALVMTDSPLDFVFAEEVAAAQAAGKPLVALESTLISHGLPYPDNIEVARAAESAVRAGARCRQPWQ